MCSLEDWPGAKEGGRSPTDARHRGQDDRLHILSNMSIADPHGDTSSWSALLGVGSPFRLDPYSAS